MPTTNESYNVAFYNQQNEHYRKRLENIRFYFIFWFSTLGGIAYLSFDFFKNSKLLESGIILFIGSIVAFIIGNMIGKNRYHLDLLKNYIEGSAVYKACDDPNTHITYDKLHIKESFIDLLIIWIVPLLIFSGSITLIVLALI